MTEKIDAARVPQCTCPECQHTLDAASATNPTATPKPGDFSICIYCATVLRFTDDMGVRRANGTDLEGLDYIEKGELLRMRLIIIGFLREKERKAKMN